MNEVLAICQGWLEALASNHPFKNNQDFSPYA